MINVSNINILSFVCQIGDFMGSPREGFLESKKWRREWLFFVEEFLVLETPILCIQEKWTNHKHPQL